MRIGDVVQNKHTGSYATIESVVEATQENGFVGFYLANWNGYSFYKSPWDFKGLQTHWDVAEMPEGYKRMPQGGIKKVEVMPKPSEEKREIPSYDGEKLITYTAHHFEVDDRTIENILFDHTGMDKDMGFDGHLFELIIESESYCNDNELHHKVLEFIADEFGGHFNINFLSSCAYF